MSEYLGDFVPDFWGQALYSVEIDPAEIPSDLVLVHAMSGFIDAGSAGQIAAEHLLDSLSHQRVMTFDHDLLIDYRSRRPTMTFEQSQWTSYEEPVLAIDVVWDATGSPFLLLHGAEPDIGWERFVAAIQDVVEALKVSLTVRLHGVPMAVPHSRPLVIGAHGSEADLIGEGLPWVNSVQIPGSAAALLELRLAEAGYPAIGLVAQVPHYLAQANYPQAAVGLLQVLQRTCDLSLPIGDLNIRAGQTSQEIEKQLAANSEARDVVRSLERQYDAAQGEEKLPSLLESSPEIPTADEIGAEFERFLMHQTERAAESDGDPESFGFFGVPDPAPSTESAEEPEEANLSEDSEDPGGPEGAQRPEESGKPGGATGPENREDPPSLF